MTIETLFNIGDDVHDENDVAGTVEQLRINVVRVGVEGDSVTQITYKVNFDGMVKNCLEDDLTAAE